MDDPKDLDDIPDFLLEAAKAPRKPPEPPKSASPAASPEKGPTPMNTQTSETPAKRQPKSAKPAPKAKARIGVPPPRVRTSIVKPTKAAPKAKAAISPRALRAEAELEVPKPSRAKAPKAPAKAKAKTAKTIRPGSKLEIITKLLTRPQGCTGNEVKEACEWPSVSMNQQAEAAGLKLRVEKKPGELTRYYGKR